MTALARSYVDVGLPQCVATAEQAAAALEKVWTLTAKGQIGPDEAEGLAVTLHALRCALENAAPRSRSIPTGAKAP